uniref:Uncharacterized protein n=1 Tax=Arundo donax TaxID=35708 RepID=A0A0A9BNN8_ARUDO
MIFVHSVYLLCHYYLMKSLFATFFAPYYFPYTSSFS